METQELDLVTHTLVYIFSRSISEEDHRAFKAWSTMLPEQVFDNNPTWAVLYTANHELMIPRDMFDAFLQFKKSFIIL